MGLNSNWNRRGFIGTAAAMVTSLFAPRRLYAKITSAANTTVNGFGQSGNPY